MKRNCEYDNGININTHVKNNIMLMNVGLNTIYYYFTSI